MKRYNLMILKKGSKRYQFEKQYFFRTAAVMDGERILKDPILSTIYTAFKITTSNTKRHY